MSTADTYDDLEDEHDDEQPDDSPVIRKLRKEARDGRKAQKRIGELEAKVFSYESQAAITAAGLTLNERQQRALLRELEPGTAPTPETLRSIAGDLGFDVPAINDGNQTAEEDAVQKVIVNASAGANTGGVPDTLTPKEFAGWDMARRVDFMNRHPEKMAALERGESVRM